MQNPHDHPHKEELRSDGYRAPAIIAPQPSTQTNFAPVAMYHTPMSPPMQMSFTQSGVPQYSNLVTSPQINGSTGPLSPGVTSSASTIGSTSQSRPKQAPPPLTLEDREQVLKWIGYLQLRSERQVALMELSKKRDNFIQIAPLLWDSVGTVVILLQQIINIYPLLNPPTLSTTLSNRACNVLALLQCIATHQETRKHLLEAHIPLFLYPFLNTVNKTKPFEYLRLASLGVVGALVKGEDQAVITFLLQTEIIPLCLRIMQRGSELQRTVATFIIQRILADNKGLNYICETADRFYAVTSVLSAMAENKPSVRLLKHIVRCFLRLSDSPNAKGALTKQLPRILSDSNKIQDLDPSTRNALQQLFASLGLQFPLNQSANMMIAQPNTNIEQPIISSSTPPQMQPQYAYSMMNDQQAHAIQRPPSFTPGAQTYAMNMGIALPPPPMMPNQQGATRPQPIHHPMYMQQPIMNHYTFGGYQNEMMAYGAQSMPHMFNYQMNMNTTTPPPPGTQQQGGQ